MDQQNDVNYGRSSSSTSTSNSTSTPNRNGPVTGDQQLMTSRIIWGALLFSVLIYGFVSFTLSQSGEPGSSVGQLVMPLTAVAGLTFVMAFLLPKIVGRLPQAAAAVRGGPLQRYFVPFIIRLTLLEAVAIYGLVLTFLSKDINYYVAFATPAVVGFLLSFPTMENFKKLVGEK